MGEKPNAADEGQTERVAAGDMDADGIAIDEEGHQRGASMSAIQNVRARTAGGSGPEPAESANLNLSKSNINREAAGTEPPEPVEASNLNLSKSNINREAAGAGYDSELRRRAGEAIEAPGPAQPSPGPAEPGGPGPATSGGP